MDKPIKARALITGSSGGIGEAVAKRLAARGYAVVVHGRRSNHVDRVVREITQNGGTAFGVLGDLTEEGIPTAIARQAADKLEGVDLIVNNAGAVLFAAIEESSGAELRRLFDSNFFAATEIVCELLPKMRERQFGRIVNVSSIVGWLPTPYLGIYSATKHALEAYTDALDHEVRGFGIRACTVQPGFTRTEIGRSDADSPQTLPAYKTDRQRAVRWLRGKIESGVAPERVARVIERAATARRPRRHYLVGVEPRVLRFLRSTVPAPLFDWGLRWQMNLD